MRTKTVDVYSVPWDLTATYHKGTVSGPSSIQAAYAQLDHMHPFAFPKALKFLDVNQKIGSLYKKYEHSSRQIIDTLNRGVELNAKQKKEKRDINLACHQLNALVYQDCKAWLKKYKRKHLILCGGEHGVGIGYLQALSEVYSSFAILQIDAHMDCRVKYFGYDYSHASVMTHYAKLESVSSITQVGIRDFDETELAFQDASKTDFFIFKDYDMHKKMFEGALWTDICSRIINTLPDHVFISCDIDALMPSLCPGTGTPVPGGLSFNQWVYLIEQVFNSKKIIGAELVEVSNIKGNDFDANVGARALKVLAGII